MRARFTPKGHIRYGVASFHGLTFRLNGARIRVSSCRTPATRAVRSSFFNRTTRAIRGRQHGADPSRFLTEIISARIVDSGLVHPDFSIPEVPALGRPLSHVRLVAGHVRSIPRIHAEARPTLPEF